MAKYLHLASREVVEARRFERYGRWSPPGAKTATVVANAPSVTESEEVHRGDYEVDTGKTYGETTKFVVPGLVFPMLYAPVAEPTT